MELLFYSPGSVQDLAKFCAHSRQPHNMPHRQAGRQTHPSVCEAMHARRGLWFDTDPHPHTHCDVKTAQHATKSHPPGPAQPAVTGVDAICSQPAVTVIAWLFSFDPLSTMHMPLHTYTPNSSPPPPPPTMPTVLATTHLQGSLWGSLPPGVQLSLAHTHHSQNPN